MKLPWKPLVLVLFAALLSSCFKTKEIIALNPDGSGKIYFQLTHGDTGSAMAATFGDSKANPTPPEERVKKKVSKILKTSKGIDAWKNVSCKVADNGEITFKGTAYFPDYSKMEIGGNMKSKSQAIFRARDGGMELLWSRSKEDEPDAPSADVDMDAEALDAAVQEAKEGLQEVLMMMSDILSGMHSEIYYRLPGTIDEVNNCTKMKENVVKVVVDGDKVLSLMKAFSRDEEAIRKVLLAGGDPVKDGPEEAYFNKMMFGNEGPVSVTVTGELTPGFDYAAESSAAAAAYPEMCKALGIDLPKQIKLAPQVEGAVSGVIHGEPFELDEAYIQGGVLHLRQGKEFFADRALAIFLFLKQGEELSGKSYEVNSTSSFGSPHIHMKYKVPEKRLPETEIFSKKYVMTLSFGKQDGTSIPGEIRLTLPDDMESSVSGNFIAEIK